MYHYEKVLTTSDQSDIIWFVSSACYFEETVARVRYRHLKTTFCFTGAIDMFHRAQLFEGRLAFNPGFFSLDNFLCYF